jgi:hypothetical protein
MDLLSGYGSDESLDSDESEGAQVIVTQTKVDAVENQIEVAQVTDKDQTKVDTVENQIEVAQVTDEDQTKVDTVENQIEVAQVTDKDQTKVDTIATSDEIKGAQVSDEDQKDNTGNQASLPNGEVNESNNSGDKSNKTNRGRHSNIAECCGHPMLDEEERKREHEVVVGVAGDIDDNEQTICPASDYEEHGPWGIICARSAQLIGSVADHGIVMGRKVRERAISPNSSSFF